MSVNKAKLEIFPLSANPELNNEEMPGLDVYYEHLNAAFEEPRICNIAVTGAFGVGKSSIIQSFEKKYQQEQEEQSKKRKNDFLYISLGNYLKDEEKKDSEKKLDVLERQLLLQIYTKYKKRELPANSFKMIQEHGCRLPIAIISGVALLMILLLGFHLQIGQLVDAIFSQAHNAKTWAHLIIYLLVVVVAAIAMGFGVYCFAPKFHIGKLKFVVKTENAEVNYDNNIAEDYLDRYTTEILYCLEQIAKNHSNTIVFEDLDRLDEKSCLSIFLRLRELNHLVNARLKRDGRFLRFIYVVNDRITAKLKSEKFFDYILPVIPRMNQKTSEKIFQNNLYKVNLQLTNGWRVPKETWYDWYYLNKTISKQDDNGLIHIIAEHLHDYRLQYNVLNEYDLLFRIYLKNKGNSRIKDEDAERLLAFAVYKNLWPEDYDQIFQGESKVFPVYAVTEKDEKVWGKIDLLKKLTNREHLFLTNSCLYYIGYDRQDILAGWRERLKKDFVKTINSVRKQDEEAREVIEKQWEMLTTLHQREIEVCSLIKYAIRCGFSDGEWFFKERSIVSCLKLLEEISDSEVSEFFRLSGMENRQYSVFEGCKDWASKLEQTWRKRGLEIFAKGTKYYPIEGKIVYFVDKVNEDDYIKDLRQYIKDKNGQ